jgi:hypothetical protein
MNNIFNNLNLLHIDWVATRFSSLTIVPYGDAGSVVDAVYSLFSKALYLI